MTIKKHQNLMYEVIENMKSMVRVIDNNNIIIYMNKRMRNEFGDKTGQKCYSLLCKDGKCDNCISEKSRETKEDQYKDVTYGGKQYRIIASPADISDGGEYSIEMYQDITEQKQLEEQFIKHYEKLKGDIQFAKQIQRKALPEDGKYWNSLELWSAYSPTEDLGGDLYDIVNVDEDLCMFYIADVSGHGVRSSLLTIFLRQAIRGLRAKAGNPSALLEELINGYHDLKLDEELYISILFGIYNRKTKALELFNAGHNCMPMVIEYRNGNKPKITEVMLKGLPICSLLTYPNHDVKRLQMEKGDRILFYTDGISEAYNSETESEFGIEGVKKIIEAHEDGNDKQLLERIIEEASSHSIPYVPDDMAAVILRIL